MGEEVAVEVVAVEEGGRSNGSNEMAAVEEGNNENSIISAKGFVQELREGSLPEVYQSISVPSGEGVHWSKTMWSFIGPGALIAVGYMDPGNWSTDLAGGSAFGYKLLFIVLLSSLIAMFLQYLAIKVGYATGRDLAQVIRDSYTSKITIYFLWLVFEAAIIATDLAEGTLYYTLYY